MAQNIVKVKILGKEYSINCPPGEAGQLHLVIEELEKRISHTQSKTMLQTNENVLVMTAINMAHDLLEQKSQLDLISIDKSQNKSPDASLEKNIDKKRQIS